MEKKIDKVIYETDISKVAKNTGISGFGEIFSIGIQYFINIIIARLYGANVFGIFVLAYTIVKISQICVNLGLSEGILRFIPLYKSKYQNARINGVIIGGTTIIAVLSFVVTIAIFFFKKSISIIFFHKPELEYSLNILIFSLPFFALLKFWLSCIQGFQLIKYRIYIEKIFLLCTWLILLIIFYFLNFKIHAVTISFLLSYLFGAILSYYYLRINLSIEIRETTPIFENKELVLFSLPLFFSGALNFIMMWTDILLLGYFRSASEIGIYESAVKAATLVIIPLNAVNTIFAPMISEYHSQNAKDKLEKMFKITTKWIFTLSFPIFLILVIFRHPIMLLFGKDFEAATMPLIFLGLAQLINAATGSVGYLLTMTGHQNINFINALSLYILNFILNFALIPKYGILGSAIATSFSISLVNIIRLVEVFYFLKIHPYKLSYWKSICSGIISTVICIYIIDFFNLNTISFKYFFVFLLFFLFSFFSLLFVFKLDEEDEFILKKLEGKF